MDYPVVFIPGLFGSLGEDVIKGTGKFTFGLAEKIYRPFIEILNSMGYIEGENLFISYYDWKKSVLISVDKYLYPDIEKIKRKTGYNKVIIIGHSLGGLLGRSYMTYFSPSSVDKLIMIGTPNLGAVDAYYFWSGGKLPYSKVEDNILYNGLKLGFMMYYDLYYNMSYMKRLRELFPVARDLLPSYGYGNYLYWEDNNVRKEIPIKNMSVSNVFLNKLEKNPIKQDNIYIISGKNYFTNKEFLIDIKKKGKTKWIDGKPIKSYKTNRGDGTVTTFSTLGNLGAHNIILNGNHTEILYKSKKHLSDILEKSITKDIKIEDIEKVYIILANDCPELEIITSDNNRISNESIDIIDDRIQAIDLGNNNFWIMATGDKGLEIKVEAEGTRKINPRIYKSTISI